MTTDDSNTFDYNDELLIFKDVEKTSLSGFDKMLRDKWDYYMEKGFFRYSMETPETRIMKGKLSFLAQLQTNRASLRRQPQSMDSLRQPFNHSQFNFTKIKEDKELIFKLHNKDLDSSSRSSQSSSRDLLIINVSPLEYGHCLLVPQVEDCLPQVQTEYSVLLALKVMLLSGSGTFRMGFNSLCAYASVNHLHWHCYYTNHFLKLQAIPVVLAGEGSQVHYIPEEEYPAAGWVFLIKSLDQLQETARTVFALVDWLSQNSVAHNIFITRGSGLAGGSDLSHVRVFVWARDSVLGTKDPGAFVMAVCELSGQILVYQEEAFKSITEDQVVEAQRNACHQVFHSVKKKAEQAILNNL